VTLSRAGFAGAALLVMAGFVLSLGEMTGLASRPIMLAAALAAALLAVASYRPLAAIPFGLAGVAILCTVTLALLGDPEIAGGRRLRILAADPRNMAGGGPCGDAPRRPAAEEQCVAPHH
jgi:hypothetical protein